jgi:hypothetical protein
VDHVDTDQQHHLQRRVGGDQSGADREAVEMI